MKANRAIRTGPGPEKESMPLLRSDAKEASLCAWLVFNGPEWLGEGRATLTQPLQNGAP
jgi:hypothetical protein